MKSSWKGHPTKGWKRAESRVSLSELEFGSFILDDTYGPSLIVGESFKYAYGYIPGLDEDFEEDDSGSFSASSFFSRLRLKALI
uniref:Uncharacterized protein n=1 Tax=Tanacetum cinerariifolium TaxID=118510 RepID=A0A6L2NXL6_TANCI|nr:hypothetical protein [Tanacetum cinerariifolium]